MATLRAALGGPAACWRAAPHSAATKRQLRRGGEPRGQRAAAAAAAVTAARQRHGVSRRGAAPAGCAALAARRASTEAARLEETWLWSHRASEPLTAAGAEALDAEVKSVECKALPTEEEPARRDALVQRLEAAARSAFDGSSVVLFGSALSGLWTPRSDLDVCVLVPGMDGRKNQIHALKKVAQVLRKVGATHHIVPRLRAQVPILRWEPRRPQLLACDVSVNNMLAVANSRLVAQYVQTDARLRSLALCVKHWARCRGINDRSKGTLSSFALTLMLIHFLQRREAPVLPSLQDLALRLQQPPLYLQGADCRYCASPGDIVAELRRLRSGRGPNGESAGRLLHEFFRHFGCFYESGTIAIRDRSSFAPHPNEENCFLVVDNPFEPGTDVANVEPRFYTRLREEFRRAHAVLSQGRGFEEACAPPPAPGTCPLVGPLLPGVNAPLLAAPQGAER